MSPLDALDALDAVEPVWAEPATADLAGGEPVTAAPDEAQPDEAGPDEAQLDEAGPGRAPLYKVQPDEAGPDQAQPDKAGPDGAQPDGAGPDQAQPDKAGLDGAAPEPGKTPPGWMRPRPAPPPGETGPQSIVPGMEQPDETEEPPVSRRRPPPAVLAEAWALARKHPLEAVSVILLGVGGLILPFPFWLIGGIVALRSRRWDARDKWIALAGPPLFTFAVLLIRAGTSAGNFFSAFYHAAQHDVGLSIRAGCVLCAGYLVWRLRRGPRIRTLPPWQRPR